MGHTTTKSIRVKKGIFSTLKGYLDRSRVGDILIRTGKIDSYHLKLALEHQKSTKNQLGNVLVELGIISRRDLVYVLARQYVLRSVATFLLFAVTFGALGTKRAKAESIRDVPAQISLVVPVSYSTLAQSHYPALLDSSEKRSNSLKAFTKWTGMFKRFERELQSSQNNHTIAEWKENLEAFQGLPMKAMATKVNSLVNDFNYIVDSRNWGQSDYWATPVEFLKRGGDCEDFAITKYAALRMLGIPESRLRVVIVHDKLKNIPHAILAVYTDEGTYLLDNQTKGLINGEKAGRYRPIFSINRDAWWLHTERNTVVASVQ